MESGIALSTGTAYSCLKIRVNEPHHEPHPQANAQNLLKQGALEKLLS